MTLAIARLNVSGENDLGWLNDPGDPHADLGGNNVRDRFVKKEREHQNTGDLSSTGSRWTMVCVV
jgi:hypothetical protein